MKSRMTEGFSVDEGLVSPTEKTKKTDRRVGEKS